MSAKYIQPSVEVLNLRIDEPVTVLTDILFALVCFYAFFRIRRLEYSGRMKWYFKYYFLTLGLGALTGGIIGHGFLYSMAPHWKLISWILSMIAVALMAHTMIELARPILKPWMVLWIPRFSILIFILAAFLTAWTLAFSPVKYYSIFAMVVLVGSFAWLVYRHTQSRGVALLIGAVGIGLLAALIFSFGWGLSPWFNHNDISHLILSFSAYTFYKGAVLILS